MRVGILDLEYYNNKTSPNPHCMKISSFHKQRQDDVKLITNKFEITEKFDLIYVTRVFEDTKNAPVRILTSSNARFFGEGMRGFINWEIPPAVSACRPDYNLYPEKETVEQRSEILQLLDEKGNKLKLKQEIKNSYKNKRTLVIDKLLWRLPKDTLLECLDEIKTYKNVTFFEPIWLKRLIEDEDIKNKFLEINFIKATRFVFKNNYSSTYESAVKIADFLLKLKELNNLINVGFIEFSPLTRRHRTQEDALQDVERCFQICELGKKVGLRFKISPLPPDVLTAFSPFFKTFQNWTEKNYEKSFMEHIALFSTYQRNCYVEDIYADSSTWTDETFITIIKLLQQRPDWINKYCMREWKDKFFQPHKINWEEIKKYII